MDDDDEPPMLVAADSTAGPAESSLSAGLQDVKVARVPITIITGMLLPFRTLSNQEEQTT